MDMGLGAAFGFRSAPQLPVTHSETGYATKSIPEVAAEAGRGIKDKASSLTTSTGNSFKSLAQKSVSSVKSLGSRSSESDSEFAGEPTMDDEVKPEDSGKAAKTGCLPVPGLSTILKH